MHIRVANEYDQYNLLQTKNKALAIIELKLGIIW